MDTTETQSIYVEFVQTEWWSIDHDQSGMHKLEVPYKGTLAIKNYGAVAFQLDSELVNLMKEDLDGLQEKIRFEAARYEVPHAIPPR